jgi:bifunctional non-homologous end joining protein LigD
MKFDGYRMLCSIRHGKVRFTSRNGLDWTARMNLLVAPAAALSVSEAILDGEVVVLDPHGVSHFQSLQNAFRASGAPLVYCVFDLLYLNGYDLTRLSLEKRKAVLQKLLPARPRKSDKIRFSEHVTGSGDKFFRKMCKAGLEGMISKRRDAPYVPGRGLAWLKCKCRQEQELVIGGFTDPGGSRVGFGALLLGYYRPDKKFAYAGRVGTGFNSRSLRELHSKLKRLQQPKCPFISLPPGHTRGVYWVRPELVAEVQFSNWTDEGLLRQASFLGLREDKPARQVIRETPTAAVR